LNPERREEIIKISHFSIAELKNSATESLRHRLDI
jgi:hypothetical protein